MNEQNIRKGDEVSMGGERFNVGEDFDLYDTVAITGDLPNLQPQPPGWAATFAALGAMNSHHFFDIRNTSVCDKAYNNQDTRDQTPYAYLLNRISCTFFAPQVATQAQTLVAGWQEPWHTPTWLAEMPQHASINLKVNQDEYLNANCLMVNSGNGPVGGGWGQRFVTVPMPGGGSEASAFSAMSQGVARLGNAWTYPIPLGIPRRAALSVVITFSEWARAKLQSLTGPYNYSFFDVGESSLALFPVMFGIRVSLHGMRLVQQRGDYAAA